MNDDYAPRQEPVTRNLTRRQRARARARARGAQPEPGGLRRPCGCRYARTGGSWYHLTPCRAHPLQEWPVTDEHMAAGESLTETA